MLVFTLFRLTIAWLFREAVLTDNPLALPRLNGSTGLLTGRCGYLIPEYHSTTKDFNVLASAAIMLLNVIASYAQAHGVLFWLMGSLSGQSWGLIAAAGAYALAGLAWLAAHAQDLNLLAAGEEGAAELGVDVERARRAVFVAASLLVGAAVSVSGMISFVGLIVPHLIRLVLGADHRLLLPASFLGGAAFLVWADALARTALAPAELPVGVVTALLGGPFFLFLLRRELGRGAS